MGTEALVNHIDKVRRILFGYLEAAYEYSRDDARTHAVFVTIYNAPHRADMECLNEVYKPVMMQHITEQNPGIVTHYAK